VFEIYNGVDLAGFARAAGSTARSQRGSERDRLVVGTVGRLEQVKDQKTLVSAFAKLLRRQPAGAREARLILVGDGSLKADLHRAIDEAGIADRVSITGWSDDVRGALREFDVFVLPSLKEGISNTILEAMACELPVIATAVGGNPELVVDGETGFLIPAQAPDRLAEAMGAYVAAPALAREHGLAGRKRVEAKFSLTKMVEAYDRLYSGFLSAAPGG
jgi:glycosyltransferase involved in cell wall biosynthesis